MKCRSVVIEFLVACCFLKEAFTLCPSKNDLAPYCYCDGSYFSCEAEHDPKPWDIARFFDKISSLTPEETVYDRFNLEATTLKEIPAGTFKKIKFRNISIYSNSKLEYIHPDAFGATLETVTILDISQNEVLTNERLSDPAYNLFKVINKFKNLEYLGIYKNPITLLPTNAFVSLPKLEELIFELSGSNGTEEKIGSKPFLGLPTLKTFRLQWSDTTSVEISDDAFEGIGKDADVSLERFPFSTFPEKTFKPLLDNARHVLISLYYEKEEDGMDCNEESAWICKDMPKYRSVLEGFNCRKDSGFNDIFDYCEKAINKN